MKHRKPTAFLLKDLPAVIKTLQAENTKPREDIETLRRSSLIRSTPHAPVPGHGRTPALTKPV